MDELLVLFSWDTSFPLRPPPTAEHMLSDDGIYDAKPLLLPHISLCDVPIGVSVPLSEIFCCIECFENLT
jgi:hypothetical protein